MEKSELIPTPILCEHITESGPFIGIPTANNEAAYLCPSCGAKRIAKLAEITRPVDLFHLLYVEKQHAQAIVNALREMTLAMRTAHPVNSLVRNRAASVARYIANGYGAGTSNQPRYMRLRYGQDDGRGAPVLKTRLPRLIEPKSLSNYNDVVAYNRQVTFA
jgi:hypothetical protein